MSTYTKTFLLLLCMIVPSTSFVSPVTSRREQFTSKQPTSLFSAMERLHDTSTNGFGPIEHVYSLKDIDYVTRKIAEDEWMALGTAIAEAMYEMILDVGDEALHEMGFVERMSVTDKIAEDVTSAVEKIINKLGAQPLQQGPYPLPEQLISSLHSLLCQELATITGTTTFNCSGHDLSLLLLSSVSDAIEAYCGITNIDVPFFQLNQEVSHRIRNRRWQLLLRHAKGYESVKDIERDIEASRKHWVRDVLGGKAAKNFHFGEVTTKGGNLHTHQEEKQKKEKRARLLSSLLYLDV
eukprot:scaffold5751_cov115-Skeletonema_dohrnii-CCMP3373.AAC.3